MGGMLALLAAVATVGCSSHAEPSPPVPDPARWVVAGPVAFAAKHNGTTRRRGSVGKKAGISVDAGSPVTLRMLTPRAGLIYRQKTRLAESWRDADRVLRVKPCAPDHPNFSDDGTVGPRTGFAGALIADRAKCVRVRVSRDAQSWVARIPVGRRCA
jgi:hypothetical protein